MCVKAPAASATAGVCIGPKHGPLGWWSWHQLGERRGLLLVQLPPDQERDDDRLDYFLRGLPDWLRVAVELRHHSWAVDPVFDLLSRHHATYVVMSGAGLPCVLRATSTTVYVRLHGPDHDHLYAGSYGEADLCWWADRIRAVARNNTLASSPTSTTTDTGTR